MIFISIVLVTDIMTAVLHAQDPHSLPHSDQPPRAQLPRARPPPLQFPGPATTEDIINEDENQFKELLREHSIDIAEDL